MKRILTSVAAVAVLAAAPASADAGQSQQACPGLMNPAGPAKRTCPAGGLAQHYGYPSPEAVLAAVENNRLRVSRPQYVALRRIAVGTEQTANQLEKNLVSARAALRQAFASGRMNPMMLNQMLSRLYTIKRNLRYVNLAAHVQTHNVLMPPQLRAFNKATAAPGKRRPRGGMGPGQMGPSGMMAPGMMSGNMGAGMSHGSMSMMSGMGGMTGMMGGMTGMHGMGGMGGMMGGGM